MDIVSPRIREEEWTDIDFHFLNGVNQVTLKPGDQLLDDDPTTIVIKLNRPPYSLTKINRANLLMYEVAQRIVHIPIDSKGQPLAPGTEEEASGSSGEGQPTLQL